MSVATLRRLLPAGAILLPALAACAPQAARVEAPRLPVYAVDFQGGAKVCNAPKEFVVPDGQARTAQMVLQNDGGWCGVTLLQANAQPYGPGLVTKRPEHGRVHVHNVGAQTRVDYFPDAAFAGEDSFTVELLPGRPVLTVAVTVQPGPAPAPTPAAATPARPQVSAPPARRHR